MVDFLRDAPPGIANRPQFVALIRRPAQAIRYEYPV
jgi:hypothetical protein